MTEVQNVAKKKVLLCSVVSESSDKTRVGVYTTIVQHPVYKKYQKKRTRIMFHDERNETKVGDNVYLRSSRPHSANKRFELDSIVVK